MAIDWHGVLPAITTPFQSDGAVDHPALAAHVERMAAAGCSGVVALGSLGEGAALDGPEKAGVLRTVVGAARGRLAVVAGVGGLSTQGACELALEAERAGCDGVMVLPPYVYGGDRRELTGHVAAVVEATQLPAMLYNNPAAYGSDFEPVHIAELADTLPRLAAVKESSGDVRRITAIRAVAGRLRLLAGIDDCVVEGVLAGAGGWVSGLANVLPEAAVGLFRLALAVREGGGGRGTLDAEYARLLPILRMDAVPKFVQLIKQAQEMAGTGTALVRPPRLPLEGAEREAAEKAITAVLASSGNRVRNTR